MSSLWQLQQVIKKYTFLTKVYCDSQESVFLPNGKNSQSSKQHLTVSLHNVQKATIRCHLLLYYLCFVSDACVCKYVIYYF